MNGFSINKKLFFLAIIFSLCNTEMYSAPRSEYAKRMLAEALAKGKPKPTPTPYVPAKEISNNVNSELLLSYLRAYAIPGTMAVAVVMKNDFENMLLKLSKNEIEIPEIRSFFEQKTNEWRNKIDEKDFSLLNFDCREDVAAKKTLYDLKSPIIWDADPSTFSRLLDALNGNLISKKEIVELDKKIDAARTTK